MSRTVGAGASEFHGGDPHTWTDPQGRPLSEGLLDVLDIVAAWRS